MSALEALPRLGANTPQEGIVVVGMGAITAGAPNVEALWQNVLTGKSHFSPLQPAEDFRFNQVSQAGQMHDFDPEAALAHVLGGKEARLARRRNERATLLSLVAAHQALSQAGLLGEDGIINDDLVQPSRVATIIGTGIGGAHYIAEAERDLFESEGHKVQPPTIFRVLPERVATVVSMSFKSRGPVYTPVAACATGSYATTGGIKEILLGNADVAVVGGTDAAITPVYLASFERIMALSKSGQSRPFDQGRDGFVMGEGAGILVLASRTFAESRKLTPLAHVIGYGESGDADHDTAPSGNGAMQAMERALRSVTPNDRLLIGAHATGTPVGDGVELETIRAISEKLDLQLVGVTALKGALGHTLGASATIETIALIRALQTGQMPPIANLTNPDPAAGNLPLVKIAQPGDYNVGIKNSFGFGGINSVLTLARS